MGTEKFSNGDVYIGNYSYGKPEGQGIINNLFNPYIPVCIGRYPS